MAKKIVRLVTFGDINSFLEDIEINGDPIIVPLLGDMDNIAIFEVQEIEDDKKD